MTQATSAVALTGGTGFLGREILASLMASGHPVRALARTPGNLTPAPGREIIQGDLANEDALRRCFEGVENVIHCAGLTHARSAAHFHRVNAGGTAAVLRAIADTSSVKRLVLISSLAAREPHLSAYAASKSAAERLLEEARAPKVRIALRPPAIYGPGDRAILPFFKLLKSGVALLPAPAKSEDARLSMIHVEDAAAAAVAALKIGTSPPAPLEIDDGTAGGHDWTGLVKAAAEVFGRDARPIHVPFGLMLAWARISSGAARLFGAAPMVTAGKTRELFHPDWRAESSQFQDLTGWKPRISIEEGFRETLEWYKKRNWL